MNAATAQIELQGRQVGFEVRRSRRRRSIGLLIDERGLRVAAPPSASTLAIENLLQEHAAWVLRKLDEWQSRQHPTLSGKAGEQIACRGVWLTLVCDDSADRPQRIGDRLLVGPSALKAEAVRRRVTVWLKAEATALFSQRCAVFSARLGLPAPQVRLSSARTRWGSCSRNGRISMNWRLIQAPLEWIDYVAAHEVAHLRQMNHSPAFWRVVDELIGDHRPLRAALRRDAGRYLRL